MKKLIYAVFAVVALALASCEKAEVDMMETVAMAGDWVMEFSDGENSWEATHCLTFNTAANIPTEMWVSDEGGFWTYQVKVKCDLSTLTFASDGWADNVAYESKVRISNGKITKNGLTLPSGRVVDTIAYDIEFDDDDDQIVWHATGRRYTGFAEDN